MNISKTFLQKSSYLFVLFYHLTENMDDYIQPKRKKKRSEEECAKGSKIAKKWQKDKHGQ